MTHIPSLTHQQLELLRLAKQNSVEEIRLSYEFPATDDSDPPIGHPPFIQGLIDVHLIEVQVKGTFLNASEFQKESWEEFRKDIDRPTQEDWDQWREGFIAQLEEELYDHMAPGNGLEQFKRVWIREISLQATQPSNL